MSGLIDPSTQVAHVEALSARISMLTERDRRQQRINGIVRPYAKSCQIPPIARIA